jgi:hypothetical protein
MRSGDRIGGLIAALARNIINEPGPLGEDRKMAKKKTIAAANRAGANAKHDAVKRRQAAVRPASATKKNADRLPAAGRPKATVKKTIRSTTKTSGIPRNTTAAAKPKPELKPKPKAEKPTKGAPPGPPSPAATNANRSAPSAKTTDRETRIRSLAYQKWEAAGKPISDGHEFWCAAEQELDGRL